MSRPLLTRLTFLGVLVGFGVVGCGAPQPSPLPPRPTGPRLPARPVELRVEGVDPCSLVSQSELAQFASEPGQPRAHTDGEFVGPYCIWSTNITRVDVSNSWVGGLSPARPAVKSLPGAEKVVQVEGFSAIQGTGGISNENTSCTLIVDIAEGQTLKTNFYHDRGEQPMNHELACQQASKLAVVMIRNLRKKVEGVAPR